MRAPRARGHCAPLGAAREGSERPRSVRLSRYIIVVCNKCVPFLRRNRRGWPVRSEGARRLDRRSRESGKEPAGMAASNINRVVLTGNLTRDPELRSLQSGTSVCSLRIASNSRRRDQSGEWVDKPNYFSVTVWGTQGENCARFLSKGRPVCIDGRLDWREWQAQDASKRESVEIVAESVQFLGGHDQNAGSAQPTADEAPDPVAVGSGADDDEDIPF